MDRQTIVEIELEPEVAEGMEALARQEGCPVEELIARCLTRFVQGRE